MVDEKVALMTRVLFHIEYQPNNPKSFRLQLWQDTVIQPHTDSHVTGVCNHHGPPLVYKKMTVAYSLLGYLENLLLSVCSIHLTTGPRVASYRK